MSPNSPKCKVRHNKEFFSNSHKHPPGKIELPQQTSNPMISTFFQLTLFPLSICEEIHAGGQEHEGPSFGTV
jgi:hypothetical protein